MCNAHIVQVMCSSNCLSCFFSTYSELKDAAVNIRTEAERWSQE